MGALQASFAARVFCPRASFARWQRQAGLFAPVEYHWRTLPAQKALLFSSANKIHRAGSQGVGSLDAKRPFLTRRRKVWASWKKTARFMEWAGL